MYILGDKIVLRGVEPYDNAMLLSLINDPDTEMMLGGGSWPVSESEQLKWFDNQEQNKRSLRCIISQKEDIKLAIGTIILSDIDTKNGCGHIHIKMSKDGGRGCGYGTDAVKALTRYSFNELRLNCIYANILTYNDISIRLFEKCGYKREGVLRSRIYKNGNFFDVYSYSIVQNDLRLMEQTNG